MQGSGVGSRRPSDFEDIDRHSSYSFDELAQAILSPSLKLLTPGGFSNKRSFLATEGET